MATGQTERPLLLERAEELAAIDVVIADALAGVGRFGVVEGSAGIGKSSIISEGRARAAAAGMTVLTARGTEIERSFSYGVVRQLFERPVARDPPRRAPSIRALAEIMPASGAVRCAIGRVRRAMSEVTDGDSPTRVRSGGPLMRAVLAIPDTRRVAGAR